jgi:predicted transglutaminase-like cysteine proteinase
MNAVFGAAAALAVAIFCSGQVSAGEFISTGKETSKPYGHFNYCKSRPRECAKQAKAKPESLGGKRWSTMVAINVSVNKAIKPVSDVKKYGKTEVWAYGGSSGDCEDYALTKRRKLINAGFKPANLRLTMARLGNGEAHTVLVVRTEKGDYVLDNLRNDVRLWHAAGYRFLKMQDSVHAGSWLSIR